MKYFVMLKNPSNGALFAMVDSRVDADAAAMYSTLEDAVTAAEKTLFGSIDSYLVFSTNDYVA